MKGLVSQLQRFSTKDGPGIRTTVFLKGCNLNCLWCHNPEMIEPGKLIKYDPRRCTHCGACARVCPSGAIMMVDGRRDYKPELCRACGACVQACMQDALELTGREYEPEELAALLLRDADYYRESGGGVTFSGGEPLLQADFLRAVARLLRKQSVPIALDTAFYLPWDRIQGVLPLVDLVLLDIKGMDQARHRSLTGVDALLIWKNAAKLSRTGKPLIVRMPLVKPLNASLLWIEMAAVMMKDWENLLHVELLPYHNLGVEKATLYPALEAQAEYERPSAAFFEHAKAIFLRHGIAVE